MKIPSRSVVAVSGTIGAGKSTLVSALAGSSTLSLVAPAGRASQERRVVPFREPVADNPYLEDFYRDPARWAFAAQVFMISHRFNAAVRSCHVTSSPPALEVHDRCFHEDRVFAEVNYRIGNISERDWETYLKLYDSFCSVVPLPDVIVYLRLDPEVALWRIQERGREEEAGISRKYLRMLHEAYEGWALGQMQTHKDARVVVVDASQTKGEVYQQVLEKLNGLAPL